MRNAWLHGSVLRESVTERQLQILQYQPLITVKRYVNVVKRFLEWISIPNANVAVERLNDPAIAGAILANFLTCRMGGGAVQPKNWLKKGVKVVTAKLEVAAMAAVRDAGEPYSCSETPSM